MIYYIFLFLFTILYGLLNIEAIDRQSSIFSENLERNISKNWRDQSSWTSRQLPNINSDVIIRNNTWLILDFSPPEINSLIIYGKLSIIADLNFPINISLVVSYIKIYGELEIISKSNQSIINIILVKTYDPNSKVPSKVIDVYGTFKASGANVMDSYYSLQKTAYSGDNYIHLAANCNWHVGDMIAVSPTAFYTQNGDTWYNKTSKMGSSLEVRRIEAIENNKILLNMPLRHTHLCIISFNETFCGYVGLLSRSTIISSPDDSLDSTSDEYGQGGLINVLGENSRIEMVNIVLKNMGDALMDSQGIKITKIYNSNTTSDVTTSSSLENSNTSFRLSYFRLSVTQSVFMNSFNTALYCSKNSQGLRIKNNVFYNLWKGAVSVLSDCSNFEVNNNLVMGLFAPPLQFVPPDVFKYQANFPIAAFKISNELGNFIGNKVAGSVDSAFAITQKYFYENSKMLGFPVLCPVTHYKAMDSEFIQKFTSVEANLKSKRDIIMNEAVASGTGLRVVSDTLPSSGDLQCSFINNFKVWRNANSGVVAVDLTSNIAIFDCVVAENMIGTNLNVYVVNALDSYIGVISSKIIGIVGYDNDSSENNAPLQCKSLSDTLWQDDAAVKERNVLTGTQLMRVGIMAPQYVNAPKTCAFTTEYCSVPFAVPNSCVLPYGKRYGLPASLHYSEVHIYGNTFGGFCRYVSEHGQKTLFHRAISLNPTQTDRFGSPILEKNTFYTNSYSNSSRNLSMSAFDIFAFRSFSLSNPDKCYGENNSNIASSESCWMKSPQAVIVDIDGSTFRPFLFFLPESESKKITETALLAGGQILFNDITFSTPVDSKKCLTVNGLDPMLDRFEYCPKDRSIVLTSNGNIPSTDAVFEPFSLYRAYWDDLDPKIHPFLKLSGYPADSIYDVSEIVYSLNGRDDMKDENNDNELNAIKYDYVSFSPDYDDCSKKILFNRLKVALADRYVHYMDLRNSTPSQWIIRWSAPSMNNFVGFVFVFDENNKNPYNVFVSRLPKQSAEIIECDSNCKYIVPSSNAITSFATSAPGTNYRDYDANSLSLTLRGDSENELYFVYRVPTLVVTLITLHSVTPVDVVSGQKSLAELIGIDANSRIKTTQYIRYFQYDRNITNGSFIEYSFIPSADIYVAKTSVVRKLQVLQLQDLFRQISKVFETGVYESHWHVDIYEASAYVPNVQQFIVESVVDKERIINSDYNVDELRLNLTKHNKDQYASLKSAAVLINPTTPSNPPSGNIKASTPHHVTIAIVVSVVISLIILLSLLAVAIYAYRRKQFNQSLNVVNHQRIIDIYRMMEEFHVSEPHEMVKAFTREMERMLDIIFTEKLNTTTWNKFMQDPSIVVELADVCSVLIKKSVVLGTEEMNYLISELNDKSEKRYAQFTAELSRNTSAALHQSASSCCVPNTSSCLFHTINKSHSHSISNSNNNTINNNTNSIIQGHTNASDETLGNHRSMSVPVSDGTQNSPPPPPIPTFNNPVDINSAEFIGHIKAIVLIVHDHYKRILYQHKCKLRHIRIENILRYDTKKVTNDSNSNSVRLASLNASVHEYMMSHVAISTMIQQNKALNVHLISELTIFENKCYSRIIKKYNTINIQAQKRNNASSVNQNDLSPPSPPPSPVLESESAVPLSATVSSPPLPPPLSFQHAYHISSLNHHHQQQQDEDIENAFANECLDIIGVGFDDEPNHDDNHNNAWSPGVDSELIRPPLLYHGTIMDNQYDTSYSLRPPPLSLQPHTQAHKEPTEIHNTNSAVPYNITLRNHANESSHHTYAAALQAEYSTSSIPPPLQLTSVREIELNREVPYGSTLLSKTTLPRLNMLFDPVPDFSQSQHILPTNNTNTNINIATPDGNLLKNNSLHDNARLHIDNNDPTTVSLFGSVQSANYSHYPPYSNHYHYHTAATVTNNPNDIWIAEYEYIGGSETGDSASGEAVELESQSDVSSNVPARSVRSGNSSQ